MKQFFSAGLLAAALCLAAGPARAADNLTMADFGHSIKLSVEGYTGTETLTNFPVLVRLSEYDESTGKGIRGFRYADLTNNKGRDIAFFDEAGNHLASEIQTNDWTTSGESLVWVGIPRMQQGTKFYLCYNTTASGVWVTNQNPWTDYVGVWHLDENGGQNKPVFDSTTNLLHGVNRSTSGAVVSEGAIGKARKIATSNAHDPGIIVAVNSDDAKRAAADSLGTDFHASFWMRAQGDVSYSYMLSRRKGDYGYSWGVQFHEGKNQNPPPQVRIFSGGAPKTNQDAFTAGECVLTDSGVGTALAERTSDPRTWKKVDVIWKDETNGGTAAYDFYINGAFVESKDLPFHVNLEENANIGIGCSTQDEYGSSPATKKGRRLNGDMDEVRLRPGIVSADWIKADYDTAVDPGFVAVAPPEVSWANGSGATPGVTHVAFDSVAFAGTVQNCGGFADCSIQCKIWATGGTEPETWTTLTNGLVALDAFAVAAANLEAETSYEYKLRAVGGTDGTASPFVSGSFATGTGFSVQWSLSTGNTGLSEVGHDYVVVAGTVSSLGEATACEIQWKLWAENGGTEPESWTTLTNGLDASDSFAVAIPGLSPLTVYRYSLRGVGDDGASTSIVSGSFTTAPGLTVAWSSATASTGIASLGYGYAAVGGQVTALGGASSCSIQSKVWGAGGTEPADWTTLKAGLVLNGTFSVNVPGLAAGTAYSYRLRAVGNDGEETAVSGSFTTPGNAGEEIGSEWTHFFDDGTNSYWVANGFERYLQFTVTGYEGSETLTNFPVLVDVRKKDTNGFSYDDFYRTDGSDMAFVDEKGHLIPHEIDTWNKNGQSLIWVRIPEMVNGTTFTMCYRSPLLEPLPDAGNVFERYVGVWHMNETANGVVNVADSTTNNLPGETHALSSADGNGRIGGGRRVAQAPGSSSSYGRIIAFDHDDILRTGVGNVFTFSGWYKLAKTPPKWGYLVARKSEDADRGWGIQYEENDTSKLRVWSGSNEKNKQQLFATPGAAATGWNYWTFVYDGSVNGDGTTNRIFHAYLNGNELASTTGGFALNYDVANDETAAYDHLVIGGQENGTGAFNGTIDEARYSKGARSPDWIKAEYSSTLQQVYWNDASRRFVTKGTSVGKGEESKVPVVVWEKSAGLPETIVDVSYAYVQFAGTVTFCGTGAETCDIEYLLWADGEEAPTDEDWVVLLAGARAGRSFSIPVTGLKQDMPYNFRIRAVNWVGGREQANREQTGSFRTTGNVNEEAEGELLRVGNKFVHRYRAGSYAFTTPDYVTNVEVLVVGGGGGGGYKVGGGGGGGGLYYSTSYPVAASTTYRIQVGEGGNAASNLTDRSGSGEASYFALDGDEENPLILVPGGGGGGTFIENAALARGGDGASGGGGSYAFAGGSATDGGAYGFPGGAGNNALKGAADRKSAAGGGGGAGRAGLKATSDTWWSGGAGGAGVACSMTGEELFDGAGGGGGYMYKQNVAEGSFTKRGAGGSGIGGDAADVRNGIPASSGVENTGAGGGGGSMTMDATAPETWWQGGHGGDGVVLIAYEIHGRDPISEDPRIEMTRCVYDPDVGDTGLAEIDYRAYWAGIQANTNDVYVLYSTVGEEDIAAGNGERILIATGAIGIGTTNFVPPAVGYTYWIRLVARKDASSYMYSDEIASFTVPAVTLNGVSWQGNTTNAVVEYKLHDKAPDSHLYCYWSETRALLEGDAPPTGEGVRFLDLGTGMSGATTFTVPASEGLDRSRVYYFRLAAGDDGGLRHPLSEEILELRDAPTIVLSSATWADQVATVGFTANLTSLDPETTELFVFYSRTKSDVDNATPHTKNGTRVSLGTFAELADGVADSASFPLWSDATTNYYVRLGLHSTTDDTWPAYSPAAAVKTITVSASNPNTLFIYANANPKKSAYGDAPQTLDYVPSYGGLTNDVAMANKPIVSGGPACAVTATTDSGLYDITQGTLAIDPTETEKFIDGTNYYYRLVFVGAKYAVTNAQFSVDISDTTVPYSGEPFDTNRLVIAASGVRNNQPVSYQYRVGTNEWAATFDTSFSNIWTHIVQFKASAPNHDDATGTFMITIEPAPLTATISAGNLTFTGAAQTPVVTTNVSPRVHPERNPLTCEFRDEAGEWQAEVPSFTQPGTYTLWFRASAPNHATAVTNCTFTISGWDFRVNMDGQNGYPTTIRVTDPAWFIRNSGHTGEELADDDTRNAALDARCANGLKLWQNYVLERELDDALVAAIHQACPRVAENHFEIRFPNVNPLGNTGLAVDYRLDRRLAGEAAFSEGPRSDKYEMNVPLGPSDPTGLYVFNIVLSTTNDPVARAVLPSCATVGVLRVSSLATNVVAAVPWMSMASTKPENEPVEVAETVNPNGLSVGDRILAYNTASNFQGWAHLSRLGTDWGALEAGEADGVAVVATNTTRFARGGAFWLVRTHPGDCFYLVGRYTGDEYTTEIAGGTAAAPAYTLVANPTMAGVNLNALVFVDGSGDPATPAAGDRIVVQDAAGFQKFYVRNAANTEWGRYVSGMSDGRVIQSWESGAAVSVPSGTGFWYVRTDQGPLAIRFGGAQ